MEEVLVIPKEHARAVLEGEGALAKDRRNLQHLLHRATYIPRDQAEGYPQWRQLIPYVLVINDRGEIFTFKRLNKQSETRLHERISVGVGGHINRADGPPELPTVYEAARREISEELLVDDLKIEDLVFGGYINDLSNEVSRDHLGCIFIYHTSSDLLVRETDKMTGSFMSLDKLHTLESNLESWSSLLLPLIPYFLTL